MAWNFSTGLLNALANKAPAIPVQLAAATISFGDGTGAGGNDQILDSDNGLAVFNDYPYYWLSIKGSTSNNIVAPIKTVAAGAIEIPAGYLTTEIAGDPVVLSVISHGSFCDIMRNSVLYIYSGSRPSDADQIENGNLLAVISRNGGTFVSGSPEYGINLRQVSNRIVERMIDPATGAAMLLSGMGLITSGATWCRLHANTVVTGASTSAIRMDGRISTSESTAEIWMPGGATITAGIPADINSFSITLPMTR